MLGWESAADVHWDRLFHAYGNARDIPASLRRLTSDNTHDRDAAIDDLHGAVLHQ